MTNIFLLIFLIIFFGKNSIRIYKNDNSYENYPWPKYYSMNENNKTDKYEFSYINDFKIFFPIDGYCMYNKNLCTQYKSKIDELEINEKNGYKIFLNKK